VARCAPQPAQGVAALLHKSVIAGLEASWLSIRSARATRAQRHARGSFTQAVKKNILIKDATHFVLFEKHRFEFYQAIAGFLKE
jgi:hypothetical protein